MKLTRKTGLTFVAVAGITLLLGACVPPPPATLPVARPAGGVPTVMVLGDSISADIRGAVYAQAGPMRYRPAQSGVPGCVPGGTVFDTTSAARQCYIWRAGWTNTVLRDRPNVVILMQQTHVEPTRAGVPGNHACDAAYLDWYRQALRGDVEAAGAGGAVVAITTATYPRWGGTFDAGRDAIVDCINQARRDVATTAPRAALVDLAQWVCPTRNCVTQVNGAVLRPDGLHYQGAGGEQVMRWMITQIFG